MAAAHPIMEHDRATTMKLLIEACNTTCTASSAASGPADCSAMFAAIGELMLQSHTGYQHCGLGSGGTDKLVMLAREQMMEAKAPSVFGAKITGGGSGGSVCVATSDDGSGQAAVVSIAAAYAKSTQHKPVVVSGSSPGAQYFDHIVLQLARCLSPSSRQQGHQASKDGCGDAVVSE